MSQQYNNITLEYTRFVKQFVAYLAYVQFNRIIYRKTHDILNYIARDDDNYLETLDKIFHKTREEERYSTAIWTDIFQEPNIAIPLMYFIELYNYLSTDPDNTDTQKYIEKALCMHHSRVFQPEPFEIPPNKANLETAISIYQTTEQYKFIVNSIIYEVFIFIDYSVCENNIDARPYYTYIEHLKEQTRKNGIIITNAKGNLEITPNILQQYTIQTSQKQLRRTPDATKRKCLLERKDFEKTPENDETQVPMAETHVPLGHAFRPLGVSRSLEIYSVWLMEQWLS
jgi:hypothetical protein